MISYFGLEIEGIDFESFEADDVVTFSGTVNKSTGGAQARAKFLTPTALTLNTSIAYDKVEVEPLVYTDIATLLTQENYELLGSIVTITITLSVEKNPSYRYFVGYDVSGSTRASFYLHDVSHLAEGVEYTLTTFIAGTSNDSIGSTIFRFSGLIFTDDVTPVVEKVTVTLMDAETTLDTLEVIIGETTYLPPP